MLIMPFSDNHFGGKSDYHPARCSSLSSGKRDRLIAGAVKIPHFKNAPLPGLCRRSCAVNSGDSSPPSGRGGIGGESGRLRPDGYPAVWQCVGVYAVKQVALLSAWQPW